MRRTLPLPPLRDHFPASRALKELKSFAISPYILDSMRMQTKHNSSIISCLLLRLPPDLFELENRLIFLNHECHNFFIHSRILFARLFVKKGGRKAQTHSFNNGITMKRVRHVISFTFNGGEKNESERMEYIRHEKQEEEKVNKLNVKIQRKREIFVLLRLIYNSRSPFPQKDSSQ
jgi:hypothetical protein